MKVSLLECADYADHSLLSEINLRNQRLPITSYLIKEALFYHRTDKICEICGSPTPHDNQKRCGYTVALGGRFRGALRKADKLVRWNLKIIRRRQNKVANEERSSGVADRVIPDLSS